MRSCSGPIGIMRLTLPTPRMRTCTFRNAPVAATGSSASPKGLTARCSKCSPTSGVSIMRSVCAENARIAEGITPLLDQNSLIPVFICVPDNSFCRIIIPDNPGKPGKIDRFVENHIDIFFTVVDPDKSGIFKSVMTVLKYLNFG